MKCSKKESLMRDLYLFDCSCYFIISSTLTPCSTHRVQAMDKRTELSSEKGMDGCLLRRSTSGRSVYFTQKCQYFKILYPYQHRVLNNLSRI